MSEFIDYVFQRSTSLNKIDNSLYSKYNVKNGLRNEDGTGVLVGLTRISDVVGYKKENGKKINYMTYIKECKNEECNKAILRVFKNIKIDEINKFIDEISCMSNERKEFYKKIINIRYKIIQEVYNKINNEKIDA